MADVGSQLRRLMDQMVGSTHRVGRALRRVIVEISGTNAFGLARMHFDQLPRAIALDEGAIAARLELGAPWAGRRRCRIRPEVAAFLIFQHDVRQTARGAVHAQTGQLAAPVLRLLASVGEINENGRPSTIARMRT